MSSPSDGSERGTHRSGPASRKGARQAVIPALTAQTQPAERSGGGAALADHARGKLLLIGGGEDKTGDRVILRRFVQESGGSGARLVVLGTASATPAESSRPYRDLFLELGAGSTLALPVASRLEAQRPELCQHIREATGIFLIGGDQLRLASILGGSCVGQALHEAYRQGAVVAGTSAGASALTQVMIVGGGSEVGPSRDAIHLAAGLGFLPEAVVDQHFAQRGRIGRLLAALAYQPGLLALGIDEDTAVLVDESHSSLEVVGSQTVTILDGRSCNWSNISEQTAQEPMTLAGVTLHVLAHGHRFDLRHRAVVLENPKDQADPV